MSRVDFEFLAVFFTINRVHLWVLYQRADHGVTDQVGKGDTATTGTLQVVIDRVRLSMSALTGMSRTVVAVGIDNEASILAAMAPGIPRSRTHSSSLSSCASSCAARCSCAARDGSEVIASGEVSARRTFG